MTIPRYALRAILDLYVVFVLILSTDAFLPLIVGGNDSTQVRDGSPVMQLAWAGVYAITLLSLLRNRGRIPPMLSANKALLAVLFVELASTLWSLDPSVTLHAGATLLLSTLVALDLSLRYSMNRMMRLVWIALATVIALSVVVELAFPGLVPGHELEAGAWHGVFGAKNEFGRIICLGVIASLALPGQSKLRRIAVVVAGSVLALLCRSAGALLYVLAMASLFAGWSVFKWKPLPRRSALGAVAILVLAAGYYVSQNLESVTAALGRDPHLTGRTDLWALSIADIGEKPLLGYGNLAFWTTGSAPARRIREEIKWDDAPHAHNGYIDILLSVGVVGLAAYFVFVAEIAKRSYRFFMDGAETIRRWPLTCGAFLLAYQLTEADLLIGNTIVWMLFCGVAFYLTPPSTRAAMLRLPQHQTLALRA
jgi:exopolysaccharide production protein ExoQ